MGVYKRMLIGGSIGLLLGFGLTVTTVARADQFNDDQVRAIEEIMKTYLLENPEIIQEANAILEARKIAAEKERARQLITDNLDALVNDSHSFVGGNPDGDVTVVEFFDYRCPYCRGWLPKIAEILQEDTNIRVVYKEYPILRPDSVIASRAAIASIPQGKYTEFHSALMSSRGSLTVEAVMEIAMEVGLDTAKLEADMKDPKIEETIEQNKKLGEALDLLGTPTFVIGDQFFDPWLSVDDFKAMVSAARSG